MTCSTPNADSNRALVTYVKERCLGETPITPDMQKLRITGETLNYDIDTIRSEEIRPDRLTPDLLQTGARNNGGFNFELSYNTYDDFLESAMYNTWERVGYKTNITSDSEITNVDDATDTITVANLAVASITLSGAIATVTTSLNHGFYKGQKVNIIGADQSEYNGIKVIEEVESDTVFTFRAAAGTVTPATGTITLSLSAAFETGHLLRTSGFTETNNNGLFRVANTTVTSGELTAIVLDGTPTLTTEAAPPTGASLQVVGFEGAADDIDASATGLTSTLLDFNTLGLKIGDWLKIGGGTASTSFSNSALNDWVRVSSISTNTIDFDNRPTNWTTEVSAGGKTLRVWLGDRLTIGTVQQSFSIEKSIQSQNSPAYTLYKGMTINTLTLNIAAGEILNGSTDFLGTTTNVSLISQDVDPTEPNNNRIFNAVNNVGRIAEGGSLITDGNVITTVDFTINNSLREQTGVGTLGLIGVGAGDGEVTGNITTFFATKDLYEKFINNTDTSLNVRVNIDSQGYVFDFLSVEYSDGSVTADARNQDVTAELSFQAKLNSDIGNQFQIQRFSEFA